jgi:CubicO group peptidase (beta-lactamase class C family)
MDPFVPIRRSAACVALWVLAAMTAVPQAWARQPDAAAALPETGATCDALASFDHLMRTFVRDNRIPGAALAVARQGQLVYARGFGYADVEHHELVRPNSLFRIASISKPITAAAILQLVDDGQLHLEDRVFAVLPQMPALVDAEAIDPRWHDVTVLHVLQHRGGWDRELSSDPMFRSAEIATSLGVQPPATPRDIIRFMMDKRLDFDPGARYAYSNFGYCVLGRVIERVSGTDYETHVRARLLAPMGIDRMRIGKTLPALRADGEVRYYERSDSTGPSVAGEPRGVQVPLPYGTWCLEAMDAHGGWIASAIDLVRFASRLQTDVPEGVLSQESLAAMVARPPGAAGSEEDGMPRDSYYGLGWSVRPVGRDGRRNLWHAGRFSGSSTILVIRHDGLCWAVLFNTSATADGRAPADKIDSLVHRAADAVKTWPAQDQFPAWLKF